MKSKVFKIFAVMSVLAGFSAFNAEATQYTVYVTYASQVNKAHTTLNSIIQNEIHFDTLARTMKLTVAPVCDPHLLCQEILRSVVFKLTQLETSSDFVAKAEGVLTLGNTSAPTTITIRQNADNATTIEITSLVAGQKIVSTFVGGNPTINDFPF